MAVIHDKSNRKFYGISDEAKRLGVTTGHLHQVLHGKRQSKRLMKRVKIKEVK